MCFLLAILLAGSSSRAQDSRRYNPDNNRYSSNDDRAEAELPRNRLFLGGSLGLGAGTNMFSIGASPEIGYTLEKWVDVGLLLNFNYTSQSADPFYNNNIRLRTFNYGGGPFVRLYPIDFIFIYGGAEQNWIKYSEKDMNTGRSSSATVNALSLIGGVGYTQRVIGSMNYYIMVGADFRNDRYSPYRNYTNSAIPIVRAGFNVYLK